MKTKLIPLLLTLVLLLCGCSTDAAPAAPAAQTFSNAGMNITLTESFFEKEHVAYTMCYTSDEIAVFTLREEYSLFDNTDFSSASTLEEYAGLVWNANQFSGNVPLVVDGDLKYFEYDFSSNGNLYTYRTYVFKDAEGFWLVQFACFTDRYEALQDTIHGYAASVSFDNPYTAP